MNHSPQAPIAIITGGAGYVGSAIAQTLKEHGWRAIALARPGTQPVDKETIICDITDQAHLDRVINNVSNTGEIRAIIHAAASPVVRKPLLMLDPSEIRADMEIGFYGAFFVMKSVMPVLTKGSVFVGITTASLEDQVPTTSVGMYIPAKAALRGFLRTLAQEIRSQGIRVNAVAPGFMPGGLNQDLPEKIRDFISKKTDPNASTLREIVEVVLEICKNPETYPTGTSISVPEKTVHPL